MNNATIYYTGNGGVFLQGGNRITLSPAAHMVMACDVSLFNRWVFTYAPGIFINGVSNIVMNNYVHNGPHMVIEIAHHTTIVSNSYLTYREYF